MTMQTHRARMESIKNGLLANIGPLTIAVLVLLIAGAGPDAAWWLRYDRARILEGEWWRLVTGNFVHTAPRHLVLNLAGLAIVWLLFVRHLSTLSWYLLALGSGLAVGLGLLVFDPEIYWYVGLSGLLHGLLIAGILLALRSGYRLELILLALVAAKLFWEQMRGPLPGSADFADVAVVVNAHLYGAIAGASLGWLPRLREPRLDA